MYNHPGLDLGAQIMQALTGAPGYSNWRYMHLSDHSGDSFVKHGEKGIAGSL